MHLCIQEASTILLLAFLPNPRILVLDDVPGRVIKSWSTLLKPTYLPSLECFEVRGLFRNLDPFLDILKTRHLKQLKIQFYIGERDALVAIITAS